MHVNVKNSNTTRLDNDNYKATVACLLLSQTGVGLTTLLRASHSQQKGTEEVNRRWTVLFVLTKTCSTLWQIIQTEFC